MYSTKREREIRLESQLENRKNDRIHHEIEIRNLDKRIKQLEKELDEVKKQNPQAIPIEGLIKGWSVKRKKDLLYLKNKHWGNGTNQEHLTLRGRSFYDVVCEEIDGIEDSNAAVYLNIPSLTLTVIELTDGWEAKVQKMQADPNAVEVFSK